MPYDSKVTGEITPDTGLEALVEFLRQRGYQLRPWRYHTTTGDEILDDQHESTGLFVNWRRKAIEGTDQHQACYGFDEALIRDLQEAADRGLIATGYLSCHGEDADDVEQYDCQDAQWRVWVSVGAYVRFDLADQMREAFRRAIEGVKTL
jgi:hypothetical protein